MIRIILSIGASILALGLVALLVFIYVVQNVEQPSYAVVTGDGDFEVRDYPPLVIAEVQRSGNREQGLRDGFGPLARYIFAREREGERIAMTSPVQQRASAADEKIAMTAPVIQSPVGDASWIVQFIMPSTFKLKDLPVPANDAIRLREIPARRLATVRFSGRTDDALIAKQEARLRAWMTRHTLEADGPPVYAYYNDPLTPGFLRRNEIMVPIAQPATTGGG